MLTYVLGDYTPRVPFLVVERPSTDLIISCDYIEWNAEAVLPEKRLLVLEDNTKASIHTIAQRECKRPSLMRAKPVNSNLSGTADVFTPLDEWFSPLKVRLSSSLASMIQGSVSLNRMNYYLLKDEYG